MKKILFIGALMLASVAGAKAHDTQPFLSPRAQSQIIQTVPAEKQTVSADKVAKSEKCTSCRSGSTALSPRAASQQTHLVAASNDPDLAHRTSTLSPRAQAQLDERQGRQFEVAPVK